MSDQVATSVGSRWVGLAGLGLLCGVAMGSVQGCDPGDLAKQCGLVCPDEGILEGNASISGVANVDAFFSAVINVRNAALTVSGSVRAELEGMAASLEIEGAGEMTLPELSAAVKAGIEAKLSAAVDGGLTIKYQPPKCEADLEVSVKAAAECDVEADPGMIEAKCEGSCEVSAEVAAMCEAMGTLECEGQAPNFECMGTCSGSCQLEVAAACEGTCNGSCDAECSVCAGGNCNVDGQGVTTNCAGQCMGSCGGECKLEAGGNCEGRCEGSCKYEAPSGGCEANATAKCDVSAMADAKCEGKCEGSVEPPMVKAECQASVDAKAKAEIVCTPPSLTVDFQFSAAIEGDANAKAEFKAWLEGFKARFSALLAVRAKLDFVAEAAADLVASADGAVKTSIETALDGDVDLKAKIGLGCALSASADVGAALNDARGELTASVSAFAEVGGAVGAGG